MFSRLYDKVLMLAGHRHAIRYLGALSFAESSFFPIPPDVMLAPMVLARPEHAWRYALVTTVTSVIGGVAGYMIGMFALDVTMPLIERAGYADHYVAVVDWFAEYGFWVVFLAGFSPIPYKIFTIAAGGAAMMLPQFFIASLVSRGARFYLVAAVIHWGGQRFEPLLKRYIDVIGWSVVAAAVVAWLVLRR